MITNEDSEQKPAWLLEIAADTLSAPVSEIGFKHRPSLDFQSNNLYEAVYGRQRIILKEFLKPDEFDEAPVREFRALGLLSELDIAPQPRAYIPQGDDHRPLVVYDYMPGQMWDRQRPTADQLEKLAVLWLQTNEVEPDNSWLSRGQETDILQIWRRIRRQFGEYYRWVESDYRTARAVVALCERLLSNRMKLIAELSSFDPPLCFCRADPRFANIITRPDGSLGMVDWEDSGLRDAALDIADVMAHPNQEDLLSAAQWNSLLDPYLVSRRRVDPLIDLRVHLYQGLLPVWWLSILLGEGLRRADSGDLGRWRIHGMEPNRKLRRYLARSLAWPSQEYRSEIDNLAELQFFPEKE